MTTVIGVSGLARSGKDTFSKIIQDTLVENGFNVKNYSFAYVLKKEVEPFLRDMCGCDVWTQNTEIKKDMRDFLVWYGTSWWRKRQPNRWIKNVERQIYNDNPDIAIITDVRYENEADWVHHTYNNGYLFHVTSYKLNNHLWTKFFKRKIYLRPPNKVEKKNDPIVKQLADFKIEWENKNLQFEDAIKNSYLKNIVLSNLQKISQFNGLT